MRTTVTLEPDVEALIRAAMRERGVSFKEALNSAIRAGLRARKPAAKPYRQRTFRMGFRPDAALDKALSIAAELEDREITRKLNLRK